MNHLSTTERVARISVTDSSGYVVFSRGDEGAAHVMAHEMLDQARISLGYERLGAWLDGRTGSGSDWTHLQFHMAIFELGIGDWDGAYARFLTEILPVAAATDEALTDGPGLLWRLAITAPADVDLPWAPLRRTAVRAMRELREPFVELHHLLAFAGAHDRESIDAWLRLHGRELRSAREQLVVQAGIALRAYVDGAYREAAARLARLVPLTQRIGGSRAQNELFADLRDHCRRKARKRPYSASHAVAA